MGLFGGSSTTVVTNKNTTNVEVNAEVNPNIDVSVAAPIVSVNPAISVDVSGLDKVIGSLRDTTNENLSSIAAQNAQANASLSDKFLTALSTEINLGAQKDAAWAEGFGVLAKSIAAQAAPVVNLATTPAINVSTQAANAADNPAPATIPPAFLIAAAAGAALFLFRK